MNPADLADQLARVAHNINSLSDLDRSRWMQTAKRAIEHLRSQARSEERLRGEALDALLLRLRGASRAAANDEGSEEAMLLLDAAKAIRTVLGVKHEVTVERGPETSKPTEGNT